MTDERNNMICVFPTVFIFVIWQPWNLLLELIYTMTINMISGLACILHEWDYENQLKISLIFFIKNLFFKCL